MQQRESVFCVLFPQSGPFIEGERGRPSVDLGCTKGALILSREPNKSTEKHVQKETSLSSMAIEPTNGRHKSGPAGNQRPECGKCVWRSAQREVRRNKGRVWWPIIASRPCFCPGPGGVITLISEPPLPPSRHCIVTPPITEECPFTRGNLHYPWARENGAAFNSKLVT